MSPGVALNQRGEQVWRGDIVLLGAKYDFSAGEVMFHVDDGSLCRTCVVLSPLRKADGQKHWGRYAITDSRPEFIPSEDMCAAAVYRNK